MTSRTMPQDEHAAKFSQVGRNLETLARNLVEQHPEFPADDFGRAFLAVGIRLVAGVAGDRAATDYMRQLADYLDAGQPTAN